MQKRGKINQAVIPLIIGFSLILVSLMFASPSFTGNAISNINGSANFRPFVVNNITSAAIVYGAYAPAGSQDHTDAITLGVRLSYNNSAIILNDVELTSAIQTNIISLGSPCHNMFTKTLLNYSNLSSDLNICYNYTNALLHLNDGQYRIKVFASPFNSTKIALIVVGYNDAVSHFVVNNFTNYEDGWAIGTDITDYVNITSKPCTSNWTAITTNCSSDETNITYYTDINNCANSTRPANLTSFCDYDRNGIIGSFTAYQDTNFDLTLLIDGTTPNSTLTYNTTKSIEFKEGNITRVKFNYDFSTPFIPSNVSIKKQPSSFNYGYMIVQGISTAKTLTIDKLSSTTNKICAVNREILDIDNVSTNCNENSEYLLDCPGNNSFITCNVSEGKYVVSGLTKSAVKEIITSTTPTCTANWTCASWSACTAAQQIRTCSDSNNCNVTVGKPLETQACTCIPKWTCSAWAPEVCTSNRTQTRSCTDSNNCNTNEGKERFPEKQSCAYNPQINSKVIILAAVIILCLLAAIVIVYFIMKNLHNHQSQQENIIIAKPQTQPIQMPINPYQTQKPTPYQPIAPQNPEPQPSLPEEQQNSENKDNNSTQ